MKRFLFSLVLMALLPMMAFAEHVEATRAQKAAQTFLSNNGVKSAQLTDVAPAAGFTNLYIFNANPGFVVMAADDRVQPILGYSFTGSCSTDDMPENVRGWLQGYDDEIQQAVENNVRASSETIRQWQDLERGVKGPRAEVVVGPLIQTKWNQNKYYNQYCPLASGGPNGHAFTGCVATAMAQIMKYYNYPSHGIGTHSYTWQDQTLSADFGATTYDWANMNLYYEYYYDDNGVAHGLTAPSSAQLAAIATLMYHCGVSVDMNYGGGGSGAVTAFVANALITYFNYSPDIEFRYKNDSEDEEWKAMVKAELMARRPLQYNGSSDRGGHSFVCDGYDDADYFHFNWGWAGHWDGYFSLSNLNSGANSSDPGAGNGNYTYNQGAIFGIQPVECAASDPTNLTYTLSGLQSITLNWTAADGAASYNIYRNNNYIGNSTNNTYSETAPFGTNVYYVRCVDANGNLSLSSNTVTITVGYLTPVVDDLEASAESNSVQLTWTAPEWCYPETETAIVSYGEGSPYYYVWSCVYYAHRYLAADLAQYANKAVYKVGTFVWYPGTYSVYVYGKTTNGQPDPNYLLASNEGVSVTIMQEWVEIDLDTPAIIDGSDDLWVVIKQEGTGQDYPVPTFDYGSYDANVCYAGSSPTGLSNVGESYHLSWFIRTYLTDGTYTYNLYRDDEAIASNLSTTTYSDNDISLGTYSYYVKTNYYAGESAASNTVNLTIAEQSLSLDTGWNWWAPQVETAVSDLQNALGSTATIMMQNGTATGYLEGGEMYRIHLPGALGNPSLTGIVADLSSIEVPIGYGVNWFGCPGTTSISLADLVITPALGDKIISQNEGFAIYGPDGWSGTLTALRPQHGYVYVSTAQEAKTLKFYTEMP